MSEDRTVPVRSSGHPVRGIRLEVRSGPDAGAQHVTDTDSVTIGTAEGNDLVLTDPTVSRFHLTLGRRQDRILVTDHDSTNGTQSGAVEIRGTTVGVRAGSTLELGGTKIFIDDGKVVMVDAGPEAFGDLRGRHPAMRRLMATAAQVAVTDVPVLILGESGTGKELIARAIHDHSDRKTEPFITVDCGSLSPTLFSSELFGHERGAFTGAERRHEGAFERADGGTVFLDEIGELPGDLQTALLGVLERGRIRRLGGTDEIPVNVRVVSATHRDLHAEVNQGTFRLDLFYRLAVVRLAVPALRERREDIPLLVEHFLAETGHSGAYSTLFDDSALAELEKHAWPGNVRELKNVVLGTLALGKPPDMPTFEQSGGSADPIGAVLSFPYRDARRELLDKFEKRYLENLLDKTGGNIRAAAREASMDRSYLMELLKRHGFR